MTAIADLVELERAALAGYSDRRTALFSALAVAAQVTGMLPGEYELANFYVAPGVVEAQVIGVFEDDDLDRIRRVHEIANSMPGFTYRPDPHEGFTSIAAVAVVDGVRVRLWEHISRRYPGPAEAEVA